MRRPFALALVASASMLPLAVPALAQEDEIVVTAQKREELLREVPQSVTAITEETFERIQANNFADYASRIPGMIATPAQNGPGTNRVSLRGIDTGGATASIGAYVDESPYGFSGGIGRGSSMTPDLDPFDIARVEVLRGPQGTLYGAGALGGLIKFVTQDPSPDEFEVRVRGTAESTDDGEGSYTARALVNVPLGDQAALRISGFQREEGGYIDYPLLGLEDGNDSEVSGFRAKFLLNATENLTFRVSATGQDFESDNAVSVGYIFDAGPGPFTSDQTLSGSLSPVAGRYDSANFVTTPQEVQYRVYNATADWDLGWASLTAASSYIEFSHELVSFYNDIDFDGPLGPLAPADLQVGDSFLVEKFTQEIRLASPGTDQGLEWLLGVYYTDERGSLDQLGVYAGTSTPFQAGNGPSEYTEQAVFGTITYHFNPEFDVAFGARYSHNDQTATIINTFYPPLAPFPVSSVASQDTDEGATTWSIAPRWRPNDRTMVYARVATGFRPGGPNPIPHPAFDATYEHDTLINYEVGVKTDVIENLLRLDAAVFVIDWEDTQIPLQIGSVGSVVNGNSVRSQGVEWQATLTPLDGLTIAWAGAYTDAHLSEDAPVHPTDPVTYDTILGRGGFEDAPLGGVPEWTSSIDVDYEWNVLNDATAFVGGNWRYVGERVSSFHLVNPRIEQPTYHVIDLRAGVDFERFTVEIFAKNAANEDQPISFSGAPDPSVGSSAVLRPRTIGVTVSANF